MESMRRSAHTSSETPVSNERGEFGASRDCSTVALRVVARQYHFHGPLFLYLITTIVLVFGAINGQNNLLFWLFGLAVGGLIVSGILSGAALMGLEVTRIAPLRAQAGSDFVVRYEIRQRGMLIPACALVVEEIDGRHKGARSSFSGRVEPGIGFVSKVQARSSARCFQRGRALQRGEVTFGAVRISTTFPFGLTRKSVVFAGESAVLIRPRMIDVHFPNRSSGNDREGASSSAQAGREGEFFALREFARGDTLRDIAWRPSARVDVPLVRAWAPPKARRELIVIDTSVDSESLEAVLCGAATLACEAFRRGVRFSMMTKDGDSIVHEGGGSWHVGEALDRLARFNTGVKGVPLRVTGVRRTLVTISESSAPNVVSVAAFVHGLHQPLKSKHQLPNTWEIVKRFLTGGDS